MAVSHAWSRSAAPSLRRRRGVMLVTAWVALAAGASGAAWSAPPIGSAIDNDASASGTGAGSGPVAAVSNAVRVITGSSPPSLAFYTDASYTRVMRIGALGAPLFLEARAAACDVNPGMRDTVAITLQSRLTGDVERFFALETGPATGVFRLEPPVATSPGTLGTGGIPGVIEVTASDELIGTLIGCGSPPAWARVWIEPIGVIFDGRSNASLAGARVELIDVTGQGNGGNPGGPARVLLADGVTPGSSVAISDGGGRYAFALVPPSTYRLAVSPPAGYRFPSRQPPSALPAGHQIDPAASYGLPFTLSGTEQPVSFHVPLDPVDFAPLTVEKTVSRGFAEVGDFLDYVVRVTNHTDASMDSVMIHDALPAGFAYVRGAARRGAAALADPGGGRGPALAFPIGGLAPREAASLLCRVQVGPGATDGDGVNRAFAQIAGYRSAPASVRVALSGSTFTDEGTIVGTVYLDGNGDSRRDRDEPGLAGIRLFLDDGTYAVTDALGQYSLYGLTPRTHALKVDPFTLPERMKLAASDHRQGSTPGLRFVDLQRGDFRRADFPIAADSVALIAATRRTAEARLPLTEIGRGARTELRVHEYPSLPGDPRARPTAAVVDGEGPPPIRSREEDATLASGPMPVATVTGAAPAARGERDTLAWLSPDRLGVGFAGRVEFLGIASGETLSAAQITLRLRGPALHALEVRVNGEPIPERNLGKRVEIAERGIVGWEYVGVALVPGENRLDAAMRTPAGGLQSQTSIGVLAPDKLARLDLATSKSARADGRSLTRVRMRALDQRGVAVPGRWIVTIATDRGSWRADDLDSATPGLQVALDGGEGELWLVAPALPGSAVLEARAGAIEAETRIDFLPELRPLLLVGVLEGTVGLRSLSRGSAAVDRPATGFEARPSSFFDESSDGTASAAARAALFARGRVREDILLTLGYDSDRPEGLRRFRDAQPDEFYPVYGDASVRGYEAQSTGQLFVRLDRAGASLLYGDFLTQGAGGTRSLTSYSRSLTGVQQHFEDRRLRLDTFASRERTRQRVDEIPGRGTSGPYHLLDAPILENSERVEIVTRRRDQQGLILSATPRQRFTDYQLDPRTGEILFKAPVPSVDADLNPVSIRVGYETPDDGRAYLVAGGEARFKPHPRLDLGGTYVDDHDPNQRHELRGAFAGAELGPRTRLEAEYGHTRAVGAGPGHGGRLELRHESGDVQLHAYGAVTDSAFHNPTSGVGAGRTEAAFRMSARLGDRTRLMTEGMLSGDYSGGGRRGGVLASVEQGLTPALRGELGMRVIREGFGPGPSNDTRFSARGKLLAQPTRLPDLSGYLELEQDLAHASRRLAALGGEYRFDARGRLYARHELLSDLAGPFGPAEPQRHLTSVIGMDTDLSGQSHLFSEVRRAEAWIGRESEAAIGLRGAWPLDAYRLGFSVERVSPLEGRGAAREATAVTGSLESTDDVPTRASSRAELRTSGSGETFLLTLGLASRLAAGWTALGRNLVALSRDHAHGTRARARIQIGPAYRNTGSRAWEGLGRYELRTDRDRADSLHHRRVVHVVSAHATGPVLEELHATFSWAAKQARENSGLDSRATAHRVIGRFTHDLGERWDVGMHASCLFVDRFDRARTGLGVENGRLLDSGVWVSAGWNHVGYRDDDLPDEEYTEQGVYMRMRAKFDETLFTRYTGAAR